MNRIDKAILGFCLTVMAVMAFKIIAWKVAETKEWIDKGFPCYVMFNNDSPLGLVHQYGREDTHWGMWWDDNLLGRGDSVTAANVATAIQVTTGARNVGAWWWKLYYSLPLLFPFLFIAAFLRNERVDAPPMRAEAELLCQQKAPVSSKRPGWPAPRKKAKSP